MFMFNYDYSSDNPAIVICPHHNFGDWYNRVRTNSLGRF